MYYPEELIEEIRQKNDIVDIISGYVNLTRKGNSYFGLCPFHNEKTPSFSVSRNKQMYYCFGCGAGGNVFTFISNYENYTFSEAVRFLADRAGVSLPEIDFSEENKIKETKRQKLLEIQKEAAKFFYYQLRNPQGKIGYDYFLRRQLTEETMKNFGLGYAGKTGTDLCRYLKSKEYSDEMIRDAGLAVFNEKYGMRDKFWNRVMFPIQDINHRVIGFGGRVMGEGEPKYLNSPETDIFDKSRNLYGLNFARTARQGNIILCEGYMDVIAMHQAGFHQAVASLGTAFTSGQANLLRRYTENVLLSYDSDGAGVKAAIRAIGILKEAGLTGKVINLEPYKDPDEFIKNLGSEAFLERIEQAENSFMFEIRMLQKQFDLKDPEGKTKFYNEIARRLCAFPQEVERENYLEAVAEEYHIGFESLRKLVSSFSAKMGGLPAEPVRPKATTRNKNKGDSAEMVQKLFLTWLCENPQVYGKVKPFVGVEDFIGDIYKEIAARLFQDFEKGQYNPGAIVSLFQDEEKQRVTAEIFNTKLERLETSQEREKAFHDIVFQLKRNSYEYYAARLGTDISALSQVIEGKKKLEELEKTHISIE